MRDTGWPTRTTNWQVRKKSIGLLDNEKMTRKRKEMTLNRVSTGQRRTRDSLKMAIPCGGHHSPVVEVNSFGTWCKPCTILNLDKVDTYGLPKSVVLKQGLILTITIHKENKAGLRNGVEFKQEFPFRVLTLSGFHCSLELYKLGCFIEHF